MHDFMHRWGSSGWPVIGANEGQRAGAREVGQWRRLWKFGRWGNGPQEVGWAGEGAVRGWSARVEGREEGTVEGWPAGRRLAVGAH